MSKYLNPMDCSTPDFPFLQSPRICSSPGLLRQWCNPAVLSSVITFSCLQSSPASGCFPVSWVCMSGGESIGASALASVHFAVQGTLKSLLQHYSSKAPILWHSAFFIVQISQPYMTTGKKKNIALTIQTIFDKLISILYIILSRFVIAFLPSSKHPLISWLQSPSAVILK